MSLSKTKKEQLNILNKEIIEEKSKVEKHKSKVEEELKEVMPEVEKAQSLVKKILIKKTLQKNQQTKN